MAAFIVTFGSIASIIMLVDAVVTRYINRNTPIEPVVLDEDKTQI
jgi:hypothetical protein